MLLHNYLVERAKNSWNKIAVRFKDECITYGQLEESSNKIANTLISKGIVPGSRVGLLLPKSISAVATIFGILKTGSAYVPLDVDSPLERIGYICSNCRLSAIIVDDFRIQKISSQASLFPEEWTVFNMSPVKPSLPEFPKKWHLVNHKEMESQNTSAQDVGGISENSLAYILYTSGSTGRPKGVMLSHMNGCAFIDWAKDYLALNDNEIFSSHAPFHFDLSIFDIYMSVRTGGTLCLIPPGISYFTDAILKFIYSNKITVWYSVPSALVQLLSKKDELTKKLQSIKTLIYAGEVFQYQYLNQFRKHITSGTIYNWYGPTETNVITSYKVETDPLVPFKENVPIGIPCSYADIHIVDENGKPVQVGETGELIVKGSSTMKGYFNDPEKTGLTLKPIEINNKLKTFYFTGDWCYRRSDGNIVYVNRRDNIIKTRGFRVDLGEIECALNSYPNVDESLAIPIPDDEITHRLFSCASLKNDVIEDEESILQHCSKTLPSYMIPEKIFFLKKFPLTSRGKVDREKIKQICLNYIADLRTCSA